MKYLSTKLEIRSIENGYIVTETLIDDKKGMVVFKEYLCNSKDGLSKYVLDRADSLMNEFEIRREYPHLSSLESSDVQEEVYDPNADDEES